ncbi:hypothetical protein [Actinophytocola sp.]|uniref:hypothetical protein n=1 Tax=Actinophytocola sp. TaxID=1872138 RepID=UPI002D72D49F|nr:hypothetical protein [Actinophytocola sp.]HYQ69047.1 hypothetical protein [Actinophytocola sp.]
MTRQQLRPGSSEWRRKFERDRARFDRWWPVWVAVCVIGAVVVLVLVATGTLPVWLLFL